MERRNFLRLGALGVASSAMPSMPAQSQAVVGSENRVAGADNGKAVDSPNIILIIADQFSYGLSKSSGYPLNTTPTLDRMQEAGVGFQRNYCTIPACVPSRTSMLTGRWPDAHRVRMNLQPKAAVFESDIYQVMKSRGYRTGLIGKNHSYLSPSDVDVWSEYTHEGGPHGPGTSRHYAEFDRYLHDLHYNIAESPAPLGVEVQLPYRIVSEAIEFIDSSKGKPFFLQVSIPEPHDPEQVPAPYWNMFPPEAIPGRCGGPEVLPKLGFRLQWQYRMQQDASPQTEPEWRRYLSNYMGALRMVDDQIKRLTDHLHREDLIRRTLVIFTADHGDSLMNFGIAHKGLGLYEPVIHTPLIWYGFGIQPSAAVAGAFTSMADLMPTLCEVVNAEVPLGVQGRSLWPLLRGESFPAEEFRSIFTSLGVGGLYYEESDQVPLSAGENPNGASFDELNMVTQSGNQKMVRMGDWKLVYDMMGYGQLYNLKEDPCELHNLFGESAVTAKQGELMAELAMWVIRAQDSLPTGPQNNKYQTKWSTVHNWYSPYRRNGSEPSSFIP